MIFGAQYLHKPIPELSEQAPDTVVKTTLVGRQGNYAERVYGDVHRVTSWAKVQPEQPAWDLRKTYDRAWEKFEPGIVDVELESADVEEFAADFEVVISTVPLWSICGDHHHRFYSVPICSKQDINALDMNGFRVPEKDTIVYNGTKMGDWYRASNILGHTSIETHPTPRIVHSKGYSLGFKVMGNDCDCHANVVRAGRMGKWVSGELTHDAFSTALEAITEQSGTPGT